MNDLVGQVLSLASLAKEQSIDSVLLPDVHACHFALTTSERSLSVAKNRGRRVQNSLHVFARIRILSIEEDQMKVVRTLSICAVALLVTIAESASADCTWTNHGGTASAVTVSGTGTIYAIGSQPSQCTPDGNCAFYKNTGGQNWVYEEGGGHGTSITTSESGALFAINTLGVWGRQESTKHWMQVATYPICGGPAMSFRQVKGDNNISVAGALSTPSAISSDGSVYYYGGSTCWVKLPALPTGTATSIAADVMHQTAYPMVLSTDHLIYYYDSATGSWQLLPGGGRGYGLAAEALFSPGMSTGQQVAIGLDRHDYTYFGGSWGLPGSGSDITQIGRLINQGSRTVVAGGQVKSFDCWL